MEGQEDELLDFGWFTSGMRRAGRGGAAALAAGEDKVALDVARHGRLTKLCALGKALTQQ